MQDGDRREDSGAPAAAVGASELQVSRRTSVRRVNGDDRVPLARLEIFAVAAILLVAFAVRVIALADMPPGLRYDELLNYRMAARVVSGDRPIYFTESWGHEPLFHYLQAMVIALTKECDWSLRLPAAVLGTLGVLVTWLVGRRLFGARVALIAASAMTVSFWSVFYSREGSRVIGISPFAGLAAYALWCGLHRLRGRAWRSMREFALAGLWMGLNIYVYVASRVQPLLVGALGIYWGLMRRRCWRRALLGTVISLAVTGAMAAPMFWVLSSQPGAEQRVQMLAGSWAALRAGEPGPVFSLFVQALGMFAFRGERDWLFNVYGRPVFDPVTAVAFLVGVAALLRKWKTAPAAFVLGWLAVGIVPAAVVPPAASLTHAIAAMTPAYIVLAVGADSVMRGIGGSRAALAAVLGAGLVGIHGVASGDAYLRVWRNAPDVQELYQSGIRAVARELDATAPAGAVAVGAPYVDYWNPWNALAFDLTLRRQDLQIRWFNPARAWVWPSDVHATTYYFPQDPLGPQSYDPALWELFAKDADRLLAGTDRFDAFKVTQQSELDALLPRLRETPISWPPQLSDCPQPRLPVSFDGRLALLGAQLTNAQVANGLPVRLVTYWEVESEQDDPLVLFVHLTSDGQDIWGQHDGLDLRLPSLGQGDRFAQVHEVTVDQEAPQEVYRLQLGVYDPRDLVRVPVQTRVPCSADRIWLYRIDINESDR
jgi:4-amino-4-deoxy-L-arabinose transferase-like glycosyltransferase